MKAFILSIFKKEKVGVEAVNYIFCTDEYLLSINLQYLKHNTFTDIITFQLSGLAQPVVSDIFISIDRVKENAAALGLAFKTELSRVMIHGALHLCGYMDKSIKHKELMTEREDFYLERLANFNPY